MFPEIQKSLFLIPYKQDDSYSLTNEVHYPAHVVVEAWFGTTLSPVA
jgi:hypothetical protein